MRRISFFLIVWMVLLSSMVAGESTTVLGPVKSMLVEGDNVKYEYFYSRTGVLIEEKNWLTGVVFQYDDKERQIFAGVDGKAYEKTNYDDRKQQVETWQYYAGSKPTLIRVGKLNKEGKKLEDIANVDGERSSYYEYDQAGVLRKKIEHKNGVKSVYQYNEKEYLVLAEAFVDKSCIAREEYFVTEHGQLLRVVRTNFDTAGKQISQYEKKYEYEDFDPYGNPKKQIDYSGKQPKVKLRTFSYYE